jgi:hypothetical protein
MNFCHLLEKHRKAILREWVDSILKTYPAETYDFITKRKNFFMQTVGQIFNHSCEKILESLLRDEKPEDLRKYIDDIVRLRAVQDFKPSEAVGFFFNLKKIIRERFSREISENGLYDELLEFESSIDNACSVAFDVFMECREKLYELKANELRNWTYRIIENSGMVRKTQP